MKNTFFQNNQAMNFFSYSKFIFDRLERMRTAPEAGESKERRDKRLALKAWVNNNPDGKRQPTFEDASYLVLREIQDQRIKKEASYLLGIIRDNWGREKAMEVYKSAFTGNNTFDLNRVKAFFTRARADKTGIYYGKRVFKWHPAYGYSGAYNSKTQRVERTNWAWKRAMSPKVVNLAVKGWWLLDERNRNSAVIKGGKSTNEATKLIRGDQFLGKTSIATFRTFKNRLNRNTGLTNAAIQLQKKRHKELEQQIMATPRLARLFLARWFIKRPEDTWFEIPEHKIGAMSMVYGRECGKYLYRRHGDKILFVPISNLRGSHRISTANYRFGGMIQMKRHGGTNRYTLGTWTMYRNYEDFFSKEITKIQKDPKRYKKLKMEIARRSPNS